MKRDKNEVTEIMFVNNVEVFPEVFANNFSGSIGNFVTDLGEVIEFKRRAVRCHGSQTKGTIIGYWGLRENGTVRTLQLPQPKINPNLSILKKIKKLRYVDCIGRR